MSCWKTRTSSARNSISDDNFVGRQTREQFRHRFPLPRQNQLRRDFTQWLQHKSSQRRSRMRQNQLRRMMRFVSERDQIHIQRTRLVENFLRTTTEFAFQFAQFSQQAQRRFIFWWNQTRNRVHKFWRPRRTIHRRSLPQRRFEDWKFGEVLQLHQRVSNDLPRISQI